MARRRPRRLRLRSRRSAVRQRPHSRCLHLSFRRATVTRHHLRRRRLRSRRAVARRRPRRLRLRSRRSAVRQRPHSRSLHLRFRRATATRRHPRRGTETAGFSRARSLCSECRCATAAAASRSTIAPGSQHDDTHVAPPLRAIHLLVLPDFVDTSVASGRPALVQFLRRARRTHHAADAPRPGTNRRQGEHYATGNTIHRLSFFLCT